MADVWPKLSEEQRTKAYGIIRRFNDTYGPKIPMAVALLTPVSTFMDMSNRAFNVLDIETQTRELHYPYVMAPALNKRILNIIKKEL